MYGVVVPVRRSSGLGVSGCTVMHMRGVTGWVVYVVHVLVLLFV